MSGENRYQRVRLDTGQRRRILLTAAALGVAGFLALGLRLFGLMILDHDRYRELALNNQSRSTPLTAPRGQIYDRNMELLATNKSVESLYLDPLELKRSGVDPEPLSEFLGALLHREPEGIAQKARDTRLRYQLIAGALEPEEADRVRQYIHCRQLQGVHLEPAQIRYYPQKTLAAQVLGFADGSGQGAEGLEAAYDSFLRGAAGRVVTTRGNHETDMPFSYERYLAAREGCSLILTLDRTVQACLEKQLALAVDRYHVINGAFGIVMEVKTGAIVAMATLGSYDPNAYLELGDPGTALELEAQRLAYLAQGPDTQDYVRGKEAYEKALAQARLKQWRNRCISDGYEPGSTFKLLTLAAALDSGAVTLDTDFYCAGAEQIPGRSQLLHCWRSSGHGAQKTTQALENSCNLAFAHIALKMGGETFYEYLERFGILEKTGVDLLGESRGVFFDRSVITDTDKWGTASLTSGAFGQTFKITPLQLVRAVASVVNGGILTEPYLVSQILDPEGNTVLLQEPTQVRRTVSEETSLLMRQLMESVVTQGTAKNAGVAGYAVGGKTGTSEKIDVFDDQGRRVLDKIVSFVGVAPMEDPQYIVLAALDTPSRETGLYISGGVMAAPTVGAIFADILPYLGVEKTLSGEDTVILADLTGMTRQEVRQYLQENGLTGLEQGEGETVTGQLPGPGETLTRQDQLIVYLEPPEGGTE